MLTYFLIFIAYSVLFIFILYRLSLKPSFVLSFKEAAFAFIVKIAAGCLYGYFYLHYYGGDDTWLYHNESLKEYALLKSAPLHFLLNDILPEGYKTNPLFTIFNSTGSYIKDLELTLFIKLLACFDLLSGGRYYVNVVLFNAIVFWGNYYLFKLMSSKYPEKRTLWLLFIFCFPPLIFWTSGIRKDGLCFAIICGLIFKLYALFEKKLSIRNIAFTISLFILLFLFRNYVAISFVPVIIAYSLCLKRKKYSLLIFLSTLFFFIAAFFLTDLLPDAFNLPKKMAERQQAFMQLSGNSYLPTNQLKGNVFSYLEIFLQPLNHVFIRPYFTEAKGILYIFSFIEIIFFFLLLFRIIFKPSEQFKRIINDPLILSFIMIAFLNYIIIGYTVPFLGAIVRYKASFEIFFLLAFLCLQTSVFSDINLKKTLKLKELNKYGKIY